MSLFTKLFGNSKDQKLMELFLELTSKVRSSLSHLNQLLTKYQDEDQVKTCCFKIQSLENDGDELVKQILESLSEISITSWISHEMVLRLVHLLDEILDNSQSIVRLHENYRLTKISSDMLLLGEVIDNGGAELDSMMSLFCQPHFLKHQDKIIAHVKKIREYEHRGDILKSQGLRALLNVDNNDQPLTMHDIAEFRSSEKMLETLEVITDDIHHLSSTVHQCLND
jgi:uncharacterized protein Yka (UPF0111/DUF47 family)